MNNSKNVIAILCAAQLAFPGAVLAAAAESAKPREIGNVVVVGWDGTRRENLKALLSAGRLPNLAKLIGKGCLAWTEVTTGATATKPGWAEILTGYSAVRLGILNNRRYRPIPPGYTVFERLKSFFGAGRIATIFITGKINNLGVRGPHEICANCVSRDAAHAKTHWWDKGGFTSSKTADGKPPRWVHRDGEPYFNAQGSFDLYSPALGSSERVGRQALAALDKYRGGPFFAFVHFEEPDEEGHVYGQNSREYREALESADHWLGEIVKKLDSLGLSGKTVVFVTTDHGMDEKGFQHYHAPDTFLATDGKMKLKDGDRKDVAPTILEAYGVDLKSIRPPLDGKSLIRE